MWMLLKINCYINFMDKRSIAFMLILPIVLTFLLGSALDPIFDGDGTNVLEVSTWLYYIDDSEGGDRFREFLDEYNERLNMNMSEETDLDTALDSVSDMIVDAYLLYRDGLITIFRNEHASQSARWLEIVFTTYLMRVSIVNDIAEEGADIELLRFIAETGMDIGSHVSIMQIEAVRRPDAIGYYAVTMLTLTGTYAMLVFVLALNAEKRRMTLKRYLLSGNSLSNFLINKSVSIAIVIFVKLSLIMLFNTFIYRVYFGSPATAIIVLLAIVIHAFAFTQIGMLFSMMIRNLTALAIALNAVILPAILFLGGAYLGYQRLTAIGLGDFAVYSPVYHINRGIFEAIYLNSIDYLIRYIIIAFVAALLLAAINTILAKWRGNSWVQ